MTPLTPRLACGQSAVRLGLVSRAGPWDLAALDQHVSNCPACVVFCAALRSMLASRAARVTSPARVAANQRNARRPRPRA